MSVWDNIRQEINTNIVDNDQQLITAEKVRTTLLDIVDETSGLIEYIEDDLNNNIQAGTYQFLQDHYYTKTEIDDHLGDVHQYVDDEIDTLHNIVFQETNQLTTNTKNSILSYCNASYYDKEYIDYLESNIYVTTDDLDDRVSCIENNFVSITYLTQNYYSKTESDKLCKTTGLFFYFGEHGVNECNCKVSYVNFINEDGPSGDFYLIECSARYGLDNSLEFNINRPYGALYCCTYSMGLYDCAVEAFTKALGSGHTPQIHKFDKNITLTTDYPDNQYQGNEIIVVANVDCDDEYSGDLTFSLVSPYSQTNVPIAINVLFRCWVQDVQQ